MGSGDRRRTGARSSAGVAASLGALMAAGAPAGAADEALIAAARKEGEVVWYTTQIVNQLAQPMAAAFKKRYGIEVKHIRANASDVALRVANEAKAGRVQADVVDGTNTTPALRKLDLVMRWLPDSVQRLPREYYDAERYWLATNIYILTPAFNTELVKAGSEPRSLEALLDPRWKGKLAWGAGVSSSAGPGFVGLILKDMGPDKGRAYLGRLAGQQIAGLNVSARQVLDQVIAGEFAIGLHIFNNHAAISAAKGAPSAWIPMEPAMGMLSVASVLKAAPRPNAGKLLLEFLISPEGQAIYRAADYMPADPQVPPNDPKLLPASGGFRAVYFTPEEIDTQMPHWMKVYRELFR